ncbi:MAG: hypothetical protein GY804_02485 [Alphaproteobacteria bacterium]|nr:hypothetical protein [Alphaproteobacteria bacterium]
MTKTKIIFSWIGGLVGFLILIFILELFGLGMFAFFEPKKENIRREVFENTKSFTHGVIQDLGKYYQEYQEGDVKEKETIKAVIQMRFPNFDATKIDNLKLQQFFINIRGY